MKKRIEKTTKGYIVGIGEITGHTHRIETGECELWDNNGQMELNVLEEGGVEVKHEEHDTRTLPKREYIVRGVEEYDPIMDMQREVRD